MWPRYRIAADAVVTCGAFAPAIRLRKASSGQLLKVIARALGAGCVALVAVSGNAPAASIGLDTPCSIIRAALNVGDFVAVSEASQVAARWMVSNDTQHVMRALVQIQPAIPPDVILQRWAQSAVIDYCTGGGVPIPERTLRQASQFAYKQTAAQALPVKRAIDQDTAMIRNTFQNMNREALDYHAKVMKNLGQ
jgi:hypothetical protein